MFTMSNETDYAMLFIEYLNDKNGWVSLSQTVDDLELPQRFMAQIAAKLVNAGYLVSKEGVNGGYKLTKPVEKIDLYDFLQLFEGDMYLVKCDKEDYECKWKTVCKHSRSWKGNMRKRLYNSIKGLKLKDVME